MSGSYSSQLEHTLLVKWGRWKGLSVGRTVRRSSRWGMTIKDFEIVCWKDGAVDAVDGMVETIQC